MKSESTDIILDNLVPGSFYSITYSISLFESKSFSDLTMTTNLPKYIFIIFCFTENHKIAEGENSEDFYFDTLITSPPTDLKCESSSSNSLKVTWDNPVQGMEGLENYAFNYRFDKGKRNVHHSLHLMSGEFFKLFFS